MFNSSVSSDQACERNRSQFPAQSNAGLVSEYLLVKLRVPLIATEPIDRGFNEAAGPNPMKREHHPLNRNATIVVVTGGSVEECGTEEHVVEGSVKVNAVHKAVRPSR